MTSSPSGNTLLLKRQLTELRKRPVDGFSAGLKDESNLFEWEIMIIGPNDTLYEGGFLRAELIFPPEYPLLPPKMKFITPMWHPNIYADGTVCISILHAPGKDEYGYEDASERWLPVHTVESIAGKAVGRGSIRLEPQSVAHGLALPRFKCLDSSRIDQTRLERAAKVGAVTAGRRVSARHRARDRGSVVEALHRDGPPLRVVHHAVGMRRARREAIQASEVLGIVNRSVKVLLAHLEERRRREQAVATRLVLLPDTTHLQVVGDILQAALERLAASHEELDVVDAWKPHAQQRKEVGLLRRQRTARHHLEQLAKVLHIDAHPLVSVKVESGLGQKIQRVRGAHVVAVVSAKVGLVRGRSPHDRSVTMPCEAWQWESRGDVLDAESEVELPCADVGWQVAVLVAEGDA
ncbi:hypothetical protein L1887_50312 [Cichorium endivia]|nr:hypothetical protein L1887_50312 [Cichorium endivia]